MSTFVVVDAFKSEVEGGSRLLDSILESYKAVIGDALKPYRNHCQRMYHYACYLSSKLLSASSSSTTAEELCTKYAIAAAFHDIGLWTAYTVDYLDPSEAEAKKYCLANGKESWIEEIGLMITRHHQILQGSLATDSTVEIFRRADLVDFSWGWIRWGVPRSYVLKIQKEIPNAGFHAYLVIRLAEWLPRNPLNPAPMFRLH